MDTARGSHVGGSDRRVASIKPRVTASGCDKQRKVSGPFIAANNPASLRRYIPARRARVIAWHSQLDTPRRRRLPSAGYGRVGGMSEDLSKLAAAVCEAVHRHAAAVLDRSDDRVAAGPALSAALQDYGVAVVNAGLEAPEGLDDFDEWLDEEDGVEHPEEEPDTSDRIAVFLRADLAVEDLGRLRVRAIEEMQECCPVEPGEDPAAAVESPYRAVFHVLGHGRWVFDDEAMQQVGLRPVAETLETMPVEALSEKADDYPWGPLLEVLDQEEQ